MQHLTHLRLESLSVDNVLQLGGLTNLQELYMCVVDDGAPVGPDRSPGMVLPDSLKKLYL
jgi:hypothetical protein